MAKQTIGEFLATQRKAKGYTQQYVVDFLGVSNRTLSAWETNKAYPDILTLPALAELYGVTCGKLLGLCSLSIAPLAAFIIAFIVFALYDWSFSIASSYIMFVMVLLCVAVGITVFCFKRKKFKISL